MNHRFGITRALCLLAVLMVTTEAHAIRPFVTDDARVVGEKLAQLETWVLVDRIALEHSVLAALGPTKWLELTVGAIHGAVHSGADRGYAITGPIAQAKALAWPARDNGWPGLAVAAGALPPLGRGAFEPPGWDGFTYAAMTESLLNEGILVHANVGLVFGKDDRDASDLGFGSAHSNRSTALVTGGVATQVRVLHGFHLIGEVYYGDPYDPRFSHAAMQLGFRHIFSERVQIDGTFGSTLSEVEEDDGSSRREQWGTLGLRLVSNELW